MGRYGVGPDFYAHLNKADTVPFNIEETAKTVCNLNYGLHRFLSAVIRIEEERNPGNATSAALRQLLAAGHY